MLILTITLTNTDHQVVLAFDAQEGLETCMAAFDGRKTRITVTDDYSRTATFFGTDVVTMQAEDPESRWEYDNKLAIIEARAKMRFNQSLGNDPSLKFLVGDVHPQFGRR